MTAIEQLTGPIVVIGAGGFLGANLLKHLLRERNDVYGVIRNSSLGSYWRLADVPPGNLLFLNLFATAGQDYLYGSVRPSTIFYLPATGNYHRPQDYQEIYRHNFFLLQENLQAITRNQTAINAFIHGGSSSEYGHHLGSGCHEELWPLPNSDYGRSKVMAGMLLADWTKHHHVPTANLRFFSVYGPLEDSQRLIPQLMILGQQGNFPPLASASLAHDFVYVDDVVDAIIRVGGQINKWPLLWGDPFNVATGKETTLQNVVDLAQKVMELKREPIFNNYPQHPGDRDGWSGDSKKIKEFFGWQAATDLQGGLAKTWDWYQQLGKKNQKIYQQHSKRILRKTLSIVVACYHDEQAILVIAEQVARLFGSSSVDYQLIFVIDGCPFGSKEAVLLATAADSKSVGIVHGRSYGSMAAFASGMAFANGDAVVLMDGDLQDPVELIFTFLERWQEGNQVVVGVRTTREEKFWLQISRKLFYRFFNLLSQEKIVPDAGEFSLLDRGVVEFLLAHQEQGHFWRALRSLAPVKTAMVNYHRPARRFGRSTNSLWRNLRWVKFSLINFYPNFCPFLTVGLAISWCLLGWKGAILMVGIMGIVAIWFLQALLLEQKKRPVAFCQSIIMNGKEVHYQRPN